MTLREEFENQVESDKSIISKLFEISNQNYIKWLEDKISTNMLPSEIYLTYDETDGEVFCAFTNKKQCNNEATDGGCGMQIVRLVNE